MPFRSTQTFEERFWSKVARQAGDECWLWLAGRDKDGYGYFFKPAGKDRAHRIVWEITHGSIPDGLCVCHRCDNPSCVRPDHLFLGTNIDNIADRDRKGRACKGEAHPYWNGNKGSANPYAKLSDDDVRAIRQDPRRKAQIARDYGVTAVTIGHIKGG